MGIQLWGAFGGFRKKTGALIGKWLNGQNVITPLPHPSEAPPTASQLLVRNKFALVVKWQSWISPIIRVGWQNAHEEKQTAFNAAFAYNYRNAVVLNAGTPELDYSKIMLAKGRLSNGFMVTLATTTDAQLDFSWGATIENKIGGPTDLLTVVVYNPAKDRYATAVDAAPRSALSYDMAVPANWGGDIVYPWVFFVSADGKLNSTSEFLAPTEVQG